MGGGMNIVHSIIDWPPQVTSLYIPDKEDVHFDFLVKISDEIHVAYEVSKN